ncbi:MULTISPECIES: sulfotransferase [unclassified Pseudoalteromonas]|uniref:sulfotransferase family protein n=1 Tax=unclassified Pseudoalteromonas TaxID=194690 RepID=UPI001601689B|nr:MULTISPECIES: sulfotransferase [unclassified Pseudoalteromonas]MBB1352350.1 sulfotransferase [Pseudoalteromonas sp. SG45-3]MBB1360463.1 sulfotransferase [Pseudoalteromonas sp. SG45-6]
MNRFFVIGSPRSGTTLFRLMLNKHKGLVVPPEAGFLTWLYGNYKDFNCGMIDDFVEDLSQTKKFASWNVDISALREYLVKAGPQNYKSLIDLVYAFYAQRVLKKNVTIMGDKNNFFLNEIDKINGIYPDCKFIHIVRDGRSVAVSYQGLASRKLKSSNAPQLSGCIHDIAKVWKADIAAIESSFARIAKDRVMCIRFEDLVLETESTLKEVSAFLNVEYDPEMLNYYLTTESEGLEPKDFLEWKEKNSKPLLPEEAYKYKLMEHNDKVIFEKICFNELQKYSYIDN